MRNARAGCSNPSSAGIPESLEGTVSLGVHGLLGAIAGGGELVREGSE
jgi:hypothetical protein